MEILFTIIRFVVAVLTVVTGVYIVLKPESYAKLAEFSAGNARGKTEVKAIMGGTFIGLGVAPIVLLGAQISFLFLGIVYLFIAATRIMSIFVDKSLTFTNLITLLVEIAFGLIMVLPI
ncbi:hypothetical protein DS65_02205 [Mesotoga sp. SC_4PWL113PWK15]|nr:hypothetical protein DS65_02205 [Mesotoga sp. SC_4PWL113PWK15]